MPMTITAVLAAGLFAAIGLRCLIAPSGGARNLGLALTAAALIANGIRVGLAGLVAAAAIMAALDALIVLRAAGLAKAAKHIAYVPLFAAFAVWIAFGS
jgi:hypothetical protein